MLKKFTKTKINQTLDKNKSTAPVAEPGGNELPKIYQQESFDKLEKPHSLAGMVAVAVILAVAASLTAVFVYEGFFKTTENDNKNAQKIIVDKQENITVTTEERLKELGEAAGKAVVGFYPRPSGANNFFEGPELLGSGLILTNDGWLVTTAGLIKNIGTAKYVVLTNNGKVYETQSVISDPASDLVFIKIEAKDLPVAKIGEARQLASGQTVYGFIADYPRSKLASLHVANVNNSDQTTVIASTEKMSAALFCREGYDASLVGSPIINLGGEVVALVNDQKQAVPAEYAQTALKTLLKKNKVERAMLGLNYINLATHPQINLVNNELAMKGALLSGYKNITAVVKGSPAEKAGLKAGDTIVGVEDELVGANNSLEEMIQAYGPGEKIKLTIVRSGEEKVVEAVLGKME